MAITNYDRVGKAQELLREGFMPVVEREINYLTHRIESGSEASRSCCHRDLPPSDDAATWSSRRFRRRPGRPILPALTAIFLLALLLAGATGTAADVWVPVTQGAQLLTSKVAGVAVLQGPGQTARLRQPLVVFSQGTAPIAGAGEQVGWVNSADAAAPLVTTPCVDVRAPAGVSATCLVAPSLRQIGAYAGKATFPNPSAPEGEEPNEVAISIVVQQSGLLFVLVAIVGTLVSVFSAWFVSEYQAVRRLREGRSEVQTETACLANAKLGSPMKLVGADLHFKRNQFDELDHSFICLWWDSLRGQRPDYKALNAALEKARATRLQFDALCKARVQLQAGRERVEQLSLKIGTGRPRLIDIINTAIMNSAASMTEPTVAFDTVGDRLEQWNSLLELTSNWINTAGHLGTLCDWRRVLTGEECSPRFVGGPVDVPLPDEVRPEDLDPVTDYPAASKSISPDTGTQGSEATRETLTEQGQLGEANEEPHDMPRADYTPLTPKVRATLHIMTARDKLQMVEGAADFEALQPDRDVQAAWIALQEVAYELLRAAPPTAQAAYAEEIGPPRLVGEEGALDLTPVGRKIREIVEVLSPRLNALVIFGLGILSLAATVLIGLQAVYVGKPWGSLLDILVLLLVGAGIHSGITGIAAAIMSGTRKEAQ